MHYPITRMHNPIARNFHPNGANPATIAEEETYTRELPTLPVTLKALRLVPSN